MAVRRERRAASRSSVMENTSQSSATCNGRLHCIWKSHISVSARVGYYPRHLYMNFRALLCRLYTVYNSTFTCTIWSCPVCWWSPRSPRISQGRSRMFRCAGSVNSSPIRHHPYYHILLWWIMQADGCHLVNATRNLIYIFSSLCHRGKTNISSWQLPASCWFGSIWT